MKFLLFVFGMLFSCYVWAQALTSLPYEGKPDAALQMYLFSSYLCPHCADFHKNILPKIRQKYLKNQAVLYFVDIANNSQTLMPAVLMRCFDKTHAQVLSDKMYEKQREWGREKDPRQKLWDIVHSLYISQTAFDQCVNNRVLMEQVIEQQNNLADLYGVTKLPTLVLRRGALVQTIEGADEDKVMEGLAEFMK